MDVEEQHRTVFAADRRQFTRLGNEISIRRLAVGDVDDDRRKSVRMLLTPRLGNLGCLLERGAHRSAAFPIWIEPDWKFDGLVHHSAGAIVRFLDRSEEHTSELQSRLHLVCRLLLEKKKKKKRDLALSHQRI